MDEVETAAAKQCETSNDFDALFAQLDRAETVAPLDGGLHRMLSVIEKLRRERARFG